MSKTDQINLNRKFHQKRKSIQKNYEKGILSLSEYMHSLSLVSNNIPCIGKRYGNKRKYMAQVKVLKRKRERLNNNIQLTQTINELEM